MFRSNLIIHLLGSYQIKLVVVKDIIYILTFNQFINSSKSVAKTLKVEKWDIKKAPGVNLSLGGTTRNGTPQISKTHPI
jgi:hypothetical protein